MIKFSKWLRVAVALFYFALASLFLYWAVHDVLSMPNRDWAGELMIRGGIILLFALTGYGILRGKRWGYWVALSPAIIWLIIIVWAMLSPFWFDDEDGTRLENWPAVVAPILVIIALGIIKKRELTK
jgi:hypothetical protein